MNTENTNGELDLATHHPHLKMLLADLAIRPDNTHVGSNLGGNASQLFFLMTQPIFAEREHTGAARFEFRENNALWLICGEKPTLAHLRKQLSAIIEKNCAIRECSFEQLTDIEFLKSIDRNKLAKTNDLDLLIACLEIAYPLKKSLRQKHSIYKEQIKPLFEQEAQALIQSFLQNMGFASKFSVENVLNYKHNLYDTFHKHSVYGPKVRAMQEREDRITKDLISAEEIEVFKSIDAFPEYMRIMVMRMVIGLEIMVCFWLDDYITHPSLLDKKKD